jgi:GNAT superfamily N-acetyltransferase
MRRMLPFDRRRYPVSLTLSDGAAVVMRPLQAGDQPALEHFFVSLPPDERFLMRDDVLDRSVLLAWVEQADSPRILPVVALLGEEIVANAVVQRHSGPSRSHHAEVRIHVAPRCRNQGLGTAMIRDLAEIAWEAGVERVDFELVKDAQAAAIEAASRAGAYPVGALDGFARDASGADCDLIFYEIQVGAWFQT